MPRRPSLSFDLLDTMLCLIDVNAGNAAKTAKQLEIKQPSMSKRLRYLQTSSPVLGDSPWIVREGKTWKLTEAGAQALPAVRELFARYRQLIEHTNPTSQSPSDRIVQVACGRFAALSFIKVAMRQFLSKHAKEKTRLHLSTLRAADRIAGVANGSLDLATVDQDKGEILKIAKCDLYIEALASHRLALVCHKRSEWAPRLATTKPDVSAFKYFPLILPEPDANIRPRLNALFREMKLLGELDIRIEASGWGTVLEYVRDKHGVGLSSSTVVHDATDLQILYFDESVVRDAETKLICRKRFNTDEPDLSPIAQEIFDLIKRAAKDSAVPKTTQRRS